MGPRAVGRLVRRRRLPAWILDLHRYLGTLTLAFVAIHVIALVADGYVSFGPKEIFVPLSSSWRPRAVTWGVLAMYGLLVIQVTSWGMKYLPRTVWHGIHFLSYAVFAAATAHGALSGADRDNPLVQALAASGVTLVVTLTVLRVLGRREAPPVSDSVALPGAGTVDPAPVAAAIAGSEPRPDREVRGREGDDRGAQGPHRAAPAGRRRPARRPRPRRRSVGGPGNTRVMTLRRGVTLLIILLAGALLAACGGGDDDVETSVRDTATTRPPCPAPAPRRRPAAPPHRRTVAPDRARDDPWGDVRAGEKVGAAHRRVAPTSAVGRAALSNSCSRGRRPASRRPGSRPDPEGYEAARPRHRRRHRDRRTSPRSW